MLNIIGQGCDYADFLKKSLSEKEITLLLYDNNLAVIAQNSYKVRPTILPYSYNEALNSYTQ